MVSGITLPQVLRSLTEMWEGLTGVHFAVSWNANPYFWIVDPYLSSIYRQPVW